MEAAKKLKIEIATPPITAAIVQEQSEGDFVKLKP